MSEIADRVEKFNAGRNPDLLKIKYAKMSASVFDFFRGTCHLFYEDLPPNSPVNEAPAAWVCGDLHLENFGIYQGDDGLVYFDINDFDESVLAPVTWDSVRFLTNVRLSYPDEPQVAQLYLDAYVAALTAGQMRAIHPGVAPTLLRQEMKRRASRKRSTLLNEYTITRKKSRHLKTKAGKSILLSDDVRQRAVAILQSWSNQQPESSFYTIYDVRTRLSGLGSMGVERYLVLVEGTGSPDGNRLLELKQRIDPSPQPYTTQTQPQWSNAAERVVRLQSRLQAIPPAPLAAIPFDGTSFTLRELYSADTKLIPGDLKAPRASRELIEIMGRVTAYAHLRGSGRQGAANADDLLGFAGESGWRKRVLDYAQAYSQQVESDYRAFCASKLGKHKAHS